jgi:hypothetical protein
VASVGLSQSNTTLLPVIAYALLAVAYLGAGRFSQRFGRRLTVPPGRVRRTRELAGPGRPLGRAVGGGTRTSENHLPHPIPGSPAH